MIEIVLDGVPLAAREPNISLRRIKKVRLQLHGRLCNSIEYTAHALVSLDRSFAAIFTQNIPSLALELDFEIDIEPKLFEEIISG